MKKWVQNHQFATFLVLTFVLFWVPLWARHVGSPLGDLMLLGGFSPWISAMIVTGIASGRDGLSAWMGRNFRLRGKLGWCLLGMLVIPGSMAVTAYALTRLLGGAGSVRADVTLPLAILVSALLIGGNEEPGWRGFATPLLVRKYHPILASCMVGLAWGLWHLPVYVPAFGGNTSMPTDSFALFVVQTMGFSVIWTWLYFRSRSVIPIMLLHGGTNQILSLLPRKPVVFHSITIHPMWAISAAACWIVALAVIALTRGRLGVPTASEFDELEHVAEHERVLGKQVKGRSRRWSLALLIVLAVTCAVEVIGGRVMDRNFAHTNMADGTRPVIATRPPAADFSFFNKSISHARKPGAPFPTDLRSCDVSVLDISGHEEDLMQADFDSKTRWPAEVKGFSAFKPDRFVELGKDPGLGLRALHKKGITGKGVGVAIIDYPLLVDHAEVKGRVRMYEEIHCVDTEAAMHGCAVSSIAVGRNAGVAPEADLYFVAVGNMRCSPISIACRFIPGLAMATLIDYEPDARAINRIVEINRHLPKDRKIRVISISQGYMGPRGWQAFRRSIAKAEAEGIFVITCALDATSGGKMRFNGLGREPLSDPDAPASYGPGGWLADDFFGGDRWMQGRTLWIPMDSRCTASPTGKNDYVFYRNGGWSWVAPYIAGLYALACQVKPDVTPDEFWRAALDTGDTVQVKHEGKTYPLEKVVNPARLIARLRSKA